MVVQVPPRSLQSFVALLMWLNAFYYMRGFRLTGPYARPGFLGRSFRETAHAALSQLGTPVGAPRNGSGGRRLASPPSPTPGAYYSTKSTS